jgi:hypothetical protein
VQFIAEDVLRLLEVGLSINKLVAGDETLSEVLV